MESPEDVGKADGAAAAVDCAPRAPADSPPVQVIRGCSSISLFLFY